MLDRNPGLLQSARERRIGLSSDSTCHVTHFLSCWTRCREEGEKFNIWVALLNLEVLHGQPDPDAALMATFSRAAPYCDQKQLYFALLGESFVLHRLL